MSLKIGDKAPDFKLFSSEKEEVSLKNFEGENLLILFFPQAFTGVCTTELCSVRDNMAFYNNVKAKVVAISVDSIFTLDRFRKDQNLNFPLLSDFNKEVSPKYGAFYDSFVFNMKGVSKRSAFVVDKKGTIQYAEVLESAGDLPDFEKITKTLESL
jgi:peroxiredoxin